jgi:hypothetical protein
MLRRWSSLALLALAVVVAADRGQDDDTVVNMVERVSEMAPVSGDQLFGLRDKDGEVGRDISRYVGWAMNLEFG